MAVGYQMGWRPDLPDFRDYSAKSESVAKFLSAVGVGAEGKAPALPDRVDLRAGCSPIEDQGQLGSCTANAAAGLVEFYERRAHGAHLDCSRLFIYKTTRDLMGVRGDTGAYLRETMKSLVLFGAPPESYWPYRISDFELEPSAFCYAFADNYKTIDYYRLDAPGVSSAELLSRIKTNLAAGMPSMFGFTVYSSIQQAGANGGQIPYPSAGERIEGGHAIDAVGYDDKLTIVNTLKGVTTKGALLIRNSWGTGWGDGGYGWLPYQYVLDGLALDWWALKKESYIDLGVFGLA